MGWSWGNIDWTATGALAALLISTGQTGVTVWGIRRTEVVARAQHELSSRTKAAEREEAWNARKRAISYAAEAIENAARELREAEIGPHEWVRLSEETQRWILAADRQIGFFLSEGGPVGGVLMAQLAQAEQIVSRVRAIMPPNETVYPSGKGEKVRLLQEQAAATRAVLEEIGHAS
jgi:hypothetical protein